MLRSHGVASGSTPRARFARSVGARWIGGAALALALAPVSSRADTPRLHAAKSDAAIERAQALHDEAARLYERGEYRDAIAKLETALALDPSGKELVYNLALIHERLGEFDDATRYYEQFLPMETDPKVREKV
ncbi:MAG TPA: tetratricopeptide repeat protein, partial [Byssovorax sp.]